MAEPVFVIHGVANRDEAAFRASVAQLARAVEREDLRFIPVFWGDLGAESDGIDDTLPMLAATAISVRTTDGMGLSLADEVGRELIIASNDARSGTRTEVRAWSNPQVQLGQAILEELVARSGATPLPLIRGGEADPEVARAVEQGVAQAWPQTRWLSNTSDPDVMAALARLVSETFTDTLDQQNVRGFSISDAVRRAIEAADEFAGALVRDLAGGFVSYVRHKLMPGLGKFLGDVFVYQRRQVRIQQRIRDVLSQGGGASCGTEREPAVVIAHSLGGVIAFDMAVAGMSPLWLKRFFTFGSQPALFHVLDPRAPLGNYHPGAAVTLPRTIGGWANLWEPLDPLAFAEGRVFRLSNGVTPKDDEVPHHISSGLWTHSAYWQHPFVARALKSFL